MNRSVYQNRNGSDPIPNNSEDHYTEPDLTEDHQYIELDLVQADISTVTGQFASTSDNQYTKLHTLNRQLEIDQQYKCNTNEPSMKKPNSQHFPFIKFDVYKCV